MKIEYKKAVVTFIDVLGFKEIVKSKSFEEVYSILAQFIDCGQSDFGGELGRIVNKHLEGTPYLDKLGWNGVSNAPPLKIINFSDSIVRIRYNENNCDFERDCLESEVTSLTFVQKRLLKMRVLVRGAVTIGDILYNEDKNILYGPAMIRAYELESRLALYPRIIIDPEITLKNKNISVDFDGMKYIDYLEEWNSSSEFLCAEKSEDYIRSLITDQSKNMYELRHSLSNLLISGLMDATENKIKNYDSPPDELVFRLDESVALKYNWIVSHYDSACDSIANIAKQVNYTGELPKRIEANLLSPIEHTQVQKK